MGGHEFQWTYNAHYYDCDARRQLTPFALLRYCEDISLLQSEEYGVGLDYYEHEQMAWILSRWDVRIHRLPRFRDKLYVTTQPMSMRRFLANRRFAIHDAEGSVMVEADSQW